MKGIMYVYIYIHGLLLRGNRLESQTIYLPFVDMNKCRLKSLAGDCHAMIWKQKCPSKRVPVLEHRPPGNSL